MVPEIGQFALVLALCVAVTQAIFPLAGAARGNGEWMAFARSAALAQFAFVGIGAAAGGRLYQLGLPHLPAAAIVTLLGAVLAAIVGLPALRMRGLFLSVATLGLALATSSWLLYQSWFVHVDAEKGSSMQLPRPHFLGVDFNDERYYYPDVFVSCDPNDREIYWCSTAVLVVEVLSPSTDRIDRFEKFEAYKRIPSLMEYGLLTQDAMELELFRRRTDWQREFYQRDNTVTFESVGLTINVSSLYRDVDFDDPAPPPGA